MKKISPALPAGFQDFSPEETLQRQTMLETIERVFRSFGSRALRTSAMQRRQVLVGGDETSKRIWNTRVHGTREINTPESVTALRFDLTVPLARYVAENMKDLQFPFRRHELGTVYRGENPGQGRFCGFDQFDFDIVGAEIGIADAETVACMVTVMRKLRFKDFVVRVNDRRILNGLASCVGLQGPEARRLLQVMDKVDKIEIAGVLAILSGEDDDEGGPLGFTLSGSKLVRVADFLAIGDEITNTDEVLFLLEKQFGDSEGVREGVKDIRMIAGYIRDQGVEDRHWVVDPSIARGLDYYTGPVFETYLNDQPGLGSVFSGGRYDDLVARFTGESLPAVGASVGVDRLWTVLGSESDAKPPLVDVFIIRFKPELDSDYLEMATELRRAGVSVEIYSSHQRGSFKAQLVTALDRHAPVILICGGSEKAEGKVRLKLTGNREQFDISRSCLVAEVLTHLGR